MKTRLADWEGKTMRDKNQSRIGRTSAITLESKYRTARNSSLNAENVRVLLWGGKRIRTFWDRYGSITPYQFSGKALKLRRIAETYPVPDEIRTQSENCSFEKLKHQFVVEILLMLSRSPRAPRVHNIIASGEDRIRTEDPDYVPAGERLLWEFLSSLKIAQEPVPEVRIVGPVFTICRLTPSDPNAKDSEPLSPLEHPVVQFFELTAYPQRSTLERLLTEP